MKKLVSLALVLVLVFCVGCGLAADKEKNLPKDGDPASAWPELAEREAKVPDYFPFTAKNEDEAVATIDPNGTISGNVTSCGDLVGVCRHEMTILDEDAVIKDENIVKEKGVYIYEHLISIKHDWVDTEERQYKQLDDKQHLVYIVYECSKCLETKVELAKEDPKDGKEDHEFEWYPVNDKLISCTEPVDLEQRCVKCGYKNGETDVSQPDGHKWDEVEKLNRVAPNCVTKEQFDYHCTVCGELVPYEDGEIDPNVHNYGKVIEQKAPTCTQDGVGYQLCWDCRDSVLRDVTIPALGHAFDNGRYINKDREPTCYKTGIKTYYCTREKCDAEGEISVENGYPENAIEEILESGKHGYGENVKKAWFWLTTAKLPHTFDNKHYVDYVDATCEEEGSVTFVCVNKDCQKYYTDLLGEDAADEKVIDVLWFDGINDEDRVIKPLGHDFKLDEDSTFEDCEDDWEAVYVCQRETCTVVDEDDIVGVPKDANSQHYGYYVEDHADYTILNAGLGHDWSVWVKQNDYEENETLGYWLRECKRCLKQDRIIAEDPTKNVIVTKVTKAPTCTEAGELTTYEYDQRDKEQKNPLTTNTTEIPALGHDLVDVEAVEATHTTPAKTAGKACSRCDYTEGVEEVKGSIKDGLCNGKDGDVTNGDFVYFEDGKISETKTGLVDYEGGKFYLKNGKIDTSLNGVDGGEKLDLGLDFYWFNNGQVANYYSGLATYTGTKGSGWFVVESGKVDLTYMGLYTYAGQRFVISYGQWAEKYNGFYWTDDEIVFVENGMVSTSSGLVNYDGAIFLIQKGVLAEDYTGEYADHNGTIFNVVNGMVQ